MHMTTPDYSSAAAESSMDEASNHHRRRRRQTLSRSKSKTKQPTPSYNDGDGGEESGEVWQAFNSNFHQVQSVLDRNRVLIQQVNDNHQSRVPDNMVKNVALIQELNGNISKVVSLYTDLNSNFSNYFHDQNRSNNSKSHDSSSS